MYSCPKCQTASAVVFDSEGPYPVYYCEDCNGYFANDWKLTMRIEQLVRFIEDYISMEGQPRD